ncbi:MAG: flavin reductase family protein [Planctomycetota bacterium]
MSPLEALAQVPLPVAASGLGLLGSLGVLGFTLRWSRRSLRHVREERASRARRLELERARVEQLERRAASSWAGYRKFQVVRRLAEESAPDVVSFDLSPFRAEGDDRALPEFLPGQYVQLRLDVPGQANLLSRCYSLSQAYSPGHYRITVARVPGASDPLTGATHPPGVASGYLLDQVRERAVLDVTVPQGDFWLDPARPEPVVLAGWGIHAAPLLCMFEVVARSTTREAWLFLEVGREEDLPGHLIDPLLELTATSERRLNVWISHGAWAEESGMGRISGRLPRKLEQPEDVLRQTQPVVRREGRQALAWIKRVLPERYQGAAHFYVSGPALMLREAKHDLAAWRVPDDRVHFEVFDRESLDAISEVEQGGGECRVTFEASNKSAAWDPEQRNLLGLAASCKVRIASTCKIGKCGECEVTLVSGKVRYTKEPDWKLKPGHCLPCVATPASPTLVLGA